MTEFKVEYDLNGFALLDAEDAEQAEFLAKEYVEENYPELGLNHFTSVTQIG